MQLNGKLQKVRNVRGILTSVVFILVGVLFVGLGIYFFIKPLDGSDGPTLSIIAIVLGAIAILAGVFTIIRSIKSLKNSKPLSEEEVKENEERLNANAPAIENVKNIKLFFHFGGKMNQSYFAEDQNGKVLYECRLLKFNPIGANTFEFVDVENSYSKTLKIGKTTTSSTSGGVMFVGDVLSSRFKIDGVECWDYLRQRGYEIKHYLLPNSKSIMSYELYKLNNKVANIVLCNIKDPWNEESKNLLRMGRGSYRIEIYDGKLEDVIMAAFIIAQVEMVE